MRDRARPGGARRGLRFAAARKTSVTLRGGACVRRSDREGGYSLVAILGGITVMLTLMAAALPAWKYVMKDAREEELIFRGGQIADAVGRYQRKNGGGLPISLEVLVKGKYLRKAYKDPLTRDGRWRLIRPGEPLPGMMGRPGQIPGQGFPGGPPSQNQGGMGEQKGLGWRPIGGAARHRRHRNGGHAHGPVHRCREREQGQGPAPLQRPREV